MHTPVRIVKGEAGVVFTFLRSFLEKPKKWGVRMQQNEGALLKKVDFRVVVKSAGSVFLAK